MYRGKVTEDYPGTGKEANNRGVYPIPTGVKAEIGEQINYNKTINNVIMKTIQEINKEQEGKLSALLDTCGIFFAFSKEQFESNKKEGVCYVRGYHGMIIPKNNVKLFERKFDEYCEGKDTMFRENIDIKEYILYQLNNHECFYTGDYVEVLELVESIYPTCTIEDIRQVFYTHINDY